MVELKTTAAGVVNMTPEMIERIALAANGGSFANEHMKKYLVRQLVRAVAALTIEDLQSLLDDRTKQSPDWVALVAHRI